MERITYRGAFTRSMTAEDRRYAATAMRRLGHGLTRRDVRRFQREQNIRVDGIIGPQTRGALHAAMARRDRSEIDPNLRRFGRARAPTERERTARPPAGNLRAGDLQSGDVDRRRALGTTTADAPPPGSSERRRFDHYASIVRRAGGEVNPNGQATVLGIRERNGVTRRFEDKVVVLSPNGRVHEFAGSTRPSNTTWRNGGVAQLQPGHYTAVPNGGHNGAPSWHVRTLSGSGRVPVARDVNGDGRYSQSELNTPRTGTEILFHVPRPGFSTPTSIGCINLARGDWNRFMDAVGGSRRGFNFTLVNG